MFRVPKSRSQDGDIGQWDAGHRSPSQQQNNSYRLHSFYGEEKLYNLCCAVTLFRCCCISKYFNNLGS